MLPVIGAVNALNVSGLDWVIVGGESGTATPKFRPDGKKPSKIPPRRKFRQRGIHVRRLTILSVG
jgi:hypothetical protein